MKNSNDFIGLLDGDSRKIQHPIDAGKVVTLYRVVALKTFRIKKFGITINKHDVGGFAESIENFCNEPCWVNFEGRIFDNAVIGNGSYIDNFSLIFGNAKIDGSRIQDYSRVYGDSVVMDSTLKDFSEVRGNSKVISSSLFNGVRVDNWAEVSNTKLFEGACCLEHCKISNSTASGASIIRGKSVLDNCELELHSVVFEGEHINKKFSRNHNLKTRIVKPEDDPYPEKIYGKGSRVIRR